MTCSSLQALAVLAQNLVGYPACYVVDVNQRILNSCNGSRPCLNCLLSPSVFTMRVASPVTMVTWHFMLTESTDLSTEINIRCIQQTDPNIKQCEELKCHFHIYLEMSVCTLIIKSPSPKRFILSIRLMF